MTRFAHALLACLADGRTHSLESLGADARRSIAEVGQALQTLREWGAPLDDSTSSGMVRLRWPVELLDRARIAAAGLPERMELTIVPITGSTNHDLGARFGHRAALLAEGQSGGRGRLGRSWESPVAAGIWLSFGFEFSRRPAALGPLALVAGIAAVEALDDPRIQLKWPNDLIAEGAKLGGILTELRAAGASTRAVIGIGINTRLPERAARSADLPWTDLHALWRGPADDASVASTPPTPPIPRNRLSAALLGRLDAACREFNAAGFEPFSDRWHSLDALRGRNIDVRVSVDRIARGIARGIASSGALRVALDDGKTGEFNAGDVSVRAR